MDAGVCLSASGTPKSLYLIYHFIHASLANLLELVKDLSDLGVFGQKPIVAEKK